MKRISIFLLTASTLLSACNAPQIIDDLGEIKMNNVIQPLNQGNLSNFDDDYVSKIKDFSNKFTSHIFDQKVASKTYSPISIYTCFMMLYEGLRGASKSELADFFFLDESKNYHEENKALIELLKATEERNNQIYSKLDINNALYIDHYFRDGVKEEYLNTITSSYYADMFQGLLSQEYMKEHLANYINERTNNLLNLTKEDFDELSGVLWLVNTMYAKATYQEEVSTINDFIFNNNYKEKKSVKAGHTFIKSIYYYQDENYMMSSIPLYGNMSLDILMPNNMNDFMNIDTYKYLSELSSKAKRAAVSFTFPYFDHQTSIDLVEEFQALGVTSIFTPGLADLSGISEDIELVVSNAKTDARIVVNDLGVEAAAYTVIEVKETSTPINELYDFIVDKPFIYQLTYNHSLPLFSGYVLSL